MISAVKVVVGERERELIKEVLDSGVLAQGPKVKEFEEKFADLCDVKHAVALNNGTAALHSALFAIDTKPGDEVITVPFTFVATANSILMQGAKPVFVDIKEDTFNIDPEKIQEAITPKTKAIIGVNLYGQVYDYNAIKKIADEHNLKLIEDAAQSVNAELDGKKSGNFGDASTFSFYATKNMITGEGGMVTTNDDNIAEKVKLLRHHGQSEKTRYEYYCMGYNYRMMDLQAAIALGQIEKINEFTEKRIRNAKLLSKGLKDIEGIIPPYVKPNAKHVFHQYTIKVDGFKMNRDELIEHLKKNGIGCGVYYPKPLHLHSWFSNLGYKKGDFPVSEESAKNVLSLPVHPYLSDEEINKIIEVIENA